MTAATPAAARRFEAQAAILAKLDHPGLPRFVDGFSEGEGAAAVRAVVTSYHPGESLERLVAKGRPLTESQALVLLRRIVPVLAYLHAFDPPLVHRTISATGIILGPDGRPCLTDLDYAVRRVGGPGLGAVAARARRAGAGGPRGLHGRRGPGLRHLRARAGGLPRHDGEDPAALLRETARSASAGRAGGERGLRRRARADARAVAGAALRRTRGPWRRTWRGSPACGAPSGAAAAAAAVAEAPRARRASPGPGSGGRPLSLAGARPGAHRRWRRPLCV